MGKLLVPHYKEYLAVSHDLLILETNVCVQRFTDCDNQVMPGKDVRLGFPELIGVEDDLIDILQGRQKSFELKGIARFNELSSPFVRSSDTLARNQAPFALRVSIKNCYHPDFLRISKHKFNTGAIKS